MAREIQIESNISTDQYYESTVAFILKNRRLKKYSITIPNTGVHTEIIEGTKFFYQKFANRHNIWAKGPVLAEMVILVSMQDEFYLVQKTYTVLYVSFMPPLAQLTWA